MNEHGKVLEEAREFMLSRMDEAGLAAPRLAVVLGSGLGEARPGLESILEIPCGELPGWPGGNVPGHQGLLSLGEWRGTRVLVQSGRLHYYQGLDMEAVTFPVSLMAGLGVERVFMSNAAGALNPAFERGNLMLVRDHINLMGVNPLRGRRGGGGEPAFLDLSDLYDTEAGDALMGRAQPSGWPLAEGVLVAVSGPTYETGAELRFMRLVGGDAVSMSLVPESLVARFLGLTVTAVSVITNVWDLRRPHAVSHSGVLDAAAQASSILEDIIGAWLDFYIHGD